MSLKDIFLVAIALGMDAFGLTISLGINPRLKRKSKIAFILSFSFFQFLFILLGGIQGRIFNKYIVTIPDILGGITVFLLGIIMIIATFKKDDTDDELLIKKAMYIILGISVSIDALVVGFTSLYSVKIIIIFLYALIVGLVALLICLVGFISCKYIRKIDFVNKYSDILGGIILIGLGIKMIVFGV
ncbi:manganese efflux pump MntP [Caproiciproducens sp. MSJ-32]|uniref:manganese efflux pump MntP n=1 Tax=Caproiciproducens sp. MSJ-32 TaxID=2841527 RepID=UPI001C11952A|nr:manganese efflux pump [Caproiciproducens sp. MSJ-32]MBU5454650.1 manganese efflux pump [Caproiciproducens sp. MSJ-32]